MARSYRVIFYLIAGKHGSFNTYIEGNKKIQLLPLYI